jgi:hypothetical protein
MEMMMVFWEERASLVRDFMTSKDEKASNPVNIEVRIEGQCKLQARV